MSAQRRTWKYRRQVSALALGLAIAALAPPALAQDIGRLLLTPQQRQDLERLRGLRGTDGPVSSAATVPSATAPPPPVPQLPASAAPAVPLPPGAPQRVQGWVLRSDGRSTVWVDGVPYYGFDAQRTVGEGAARRPVDLLPEGALRIQRRP